eukprot:TRINITY_DN30859_c0_g1_i1.p1 TRINITY_DN30859_c0_g1~~TRINITY_DN30859_c0_g1_i1.p1  ORF type:complete len:430 (+),score=76.06 TRINITY_DN30859_c0_g1_i1:2051-3340(+)
MSSVCVIGAGFAGICVGKCLREDGFDVTIFESRSFYGGTWHPQGSGYIHLKANNQWPTFEFSDVPYPPRTSQPDGITISQQDHWEYIQKYVKLHNLERVMQLSCAVESVTRRQPAGWTVVVKSTVSNESSSREFDFVVVCSGLFNVPKVPCWPGMKEFNDSGGKVYHSSHVQSEHLLRDKKVLVVGGSKSAFDMINAATVLNKKIKPTIISKRFYLHVELVGEFKDTSILWTKAFGATKRWPETHNFGHWFLTRTTLGRKLTVAFEKQLDMAVRKNQKIRKEDNNPLYPKDPFPDFIAYSGIDRGTYQMALEGRLNAKQGVTIKSLDSERMVHFSDGTSEQFDVIVAATGFKQQFPFFSAEEASRLGVVQEQGEEEKNCEMSNFRSTMRLYRSILPPEEPTIGFIGFVLVLDSAMTFSASESHSLRNRK